MKQKVMVFLDALLDTRLSSVAQVNEDWAGELLKQGWHNRKNDNYQLLVAEVDNERCWQQYRNRDASVLQGAFVTDIVEVVAMIVSQIESEISINPRLEELAVEINLWPYQVSDEYIDAFKTVLSAYMPLGVRVTHTSIPYQQLTPDYIRGTYAAIMLYDVHDWLDEFKGLLEPQPGETKPKGFMCPTVQLWGAQKYLDDKNPAHNTDWEIGLEFEAMALTPHISLQYLPVQAFSINLERIMKMAG